MMIRLKRRRSRRNTESKLDIEEDEENSEKHVK